MARAAIPIPEDPVKALSAAHTRGLRLLGGRELSESAVRQRLAAIGFEPPTIDAAIARLLQTGALDEHRAVRAVARTVVQVKKRGRLRALRELEARGFAKAAASEALAELLAPEDERALVERALDARLRGRGVTPGDLAGMRRLLSALVRQGFPPSAVRDAIRARARGASRLDDEGTDE